ncbi:restriction endonuclease [Kurthia gibsonii]|uniref:restriction endonuclease n=1 Tax=Kurthia gibsonii TaxID=33946 RepID=UPI003F272EE9
MERSFDWLWDKYKEGARDKFEEVCYKIYKNEHPDAEVKRVRVQHGDGGIDVYIDYPDKFIVVQCKFFINELGDSQKSQIRNSLGSVDKTELNEWILAVPLILSEKEASWWRKWKKVKEEEFGIKIRLHDEDDLLDLLKKHNLYDDYFNTVKFDKDFIEDVVGKDEKKNIHDRLYPLISELSGVYYNLWDIVVQVDQLADLRAHRLFKENTLLLNLNRLTNLYALHAEGNSIFGKRLRSEEKISEETELRKKIMEDYYNLGL